MPAQHGHGGKKGIKIKVDKVLTRRRRILETILAGLLKVRERLEALVADDPWPWLESDEDLGRARPWPHYRRAPLRDGDEVFE